MEEKKNVKMSVAKNEEATEKMSYEQLENIAHQLSEQNRQMYQQLQSANMANIFKRLDYLFMVIKESVMFPDDFVAKCVDEVVDTITIPESKEEETNESEA